MNQEQPETHIEQEKRPDIEYSFFFNVHGTEKDFEKLEESLKDADVYVPELFGWTQEDLDKLNAISQGNLDPEKTSMPRGSNWWKVITLLYKSEKPVLLADVQEGDELLDLKKESDTHFGKAMDLFALGKLNEAIEEYKACSQANFEYQTGREKKIKENLQEQIDRFLEENPKWKDKDKIRVLISLGVAHTPLYHSLKEEKSSTKRTFSSPLMVYPTEGEILMRLHQGKEVSDELYAKALIERSVDDYLLPISDDSEKVIQVSRKIVSQFSMDDIRKISENCARNRSKPVEEIRNLGIHIPETEEEMNEMFPKSKLHPYGTKNKKQNPS